MNNFTKIPDTVLENALIGTSDLFNRNIIEHVCFLQRISCDQKLASDSSGLPGGFSGQRAWVRILKKWAPGSYCLELVVACPAAGTSALILLVEGS
jgi:hypothetical protein